MRPRLCGPPAWSARLSPHSADGPRDCAAGERGSARLSPHSAAGAFDCAAGERADARLGPHGREQGFVTVATIGLAAVLLAVATLIATLGAVTVTRHRAASAADLAALAGADHALEGQAQACGEAAKVARAQDTELVDCELDGEQVSVIVAAHLGSLGEARARATAGPVS